MTRIVRLSTVSVSTLFATACSLLRTQTSSPCREIIRRRYILHETSASLSAGLRQSAALKKTSASSYGKTGVMIIFEPIRPGQTKLVTRILTMIWLDCNKFALSWLARPVFISKQRAYSRLRARASTLNDMLAVMVPWQIRRNINPQYFMRGYTLYGPSINEHWWCREGLVLEKIN